jgi:predicted peroxiredoxin
MHIERDVMRVYASFAASLGSSSVENEGQFFVVMLPVQAGNYK